MAEQPKPGDYVGLYLDDKLIYTGVGIKKEPALPEGCGS